MTTPDHLKITGPEDILGFIPHSLGYWPVNSLVAMTIQGTRLGATLRVDLPEPRRCRGPALAAFVRTVRGYLKADGDADGAVLAIFSDPPGDGEGANGDGGMPAPALERLLRDLESTLGEAGLPVRDAWLVGKRYWRDAHCVDPSCCPRPGRPIEEIRDSRLNAELVYRGSSVGAPPGINPSHGPAAPGRPAALEAEADWTREFAGRWRDRAQFDAVLDVWARVLISAALPGRRRPATGRDSAVPAVGPGRLSDGLAGYLRATLRVAAWRDAVLVMAAAGRSAALAGAEDFGMFNGGPGNAAALPGLDGFPPLPAQEAVPWAAAERGPAEKGAADDTAEVPGYGDVLLGLEPPTPDWAWLAGLDRVLLGLNDCGGGEALAAGLTARGWIEWCRGRGSFADALFTAAAEEQPGYRLAELLAELVRRGTLCGWAARKDSAWQKFDPDAA